jgi:glycosyltransferase involved in cell wall biosynthesis
MRVAVYAKVLSEAEPTGIGIYVRNILGALARLAPEDEFTLYSNEPFQQHIPGANVHERVLRFPRLWSYLRFPFEFLGDRYDVLFSPKEQVPPCFRPPTVLVVYDLMGLLFPERISLAGKAHFYQAVHYAIPRAEQVIAISEQTKRSVVEQCGVDPERVTVTPLGYDRDLYRPCEDPARIASAMSRYRIDGPYLINTSSVIWYRKNLVRVLQAFAQLVAERRGEAPRLVITGKRGEAYEEILTWRRKLGIEREVILTGYIPASDMPVLLSGAEALVFPSLDEGFGLPLVEAMACGCPVVTANVSAMPEVVGDAGLLVDPLDVIGLHAAMDAVFRRPVRQADLRRRGLQRAVQFSWDEAARATLAVLRATAAAGRSS